MTELAGPTQISDHAKASCRGGGGGLQLQRSSGLQYCSKRRIRRWRESANRRKPSPKTSSPSEQRRHKLWGEIISSVNNIAEQSRLLALERLHPGGRGRDTGRTFSVVANEMKNLAATIEAGHRAGALHSGQHTERDQHLGDAHRGGWSNGRNRGARQSQVADQTIRQLTENLEESIPRVPADCRRQRPAADRLRAGSAGVPEYRSGHAGNRDQHQAIRTGGRESQRAGAATPFGDGRYRV